MNDLNLILDHLQALFGQKANHLAFKSEFRSRPSKLGGAELAFALVGGWLVNPKASRSELANIAGVGKQALDQSLTQKAANFLQSLLEWVVSRAVSGEPTTLELLGRFKAVYVLDSSSVNLPAALREEWVGCGKLGSRNAAGIKLHTALDLVQGQLLGPVLTPATTHDQAGPELLAHCEAGSLRLADLGYFDLADLAGLGRQQCYFVSRVKSNVHLYRTDGTSCSVGQWLSELKQGQTQLDQTVVVGQAERLECRLVGWQVNQEVLAQRQAGFKEQVRKRQRAISQEQHRMSYWMLYLTNVPPELVSGAQVGVLYRMRWQIELVFKLWKEQAEIDQWRSRKKWAILCEFYAKLIGVVVQHWLVLATAWQEGERSLIKVCRVIRQRAWSWLRYLQDWLRVGPSERACLAFELAELGPWVGKGCKLDRAKAQPSSFQLLLSSPALPLVSHST
jgi:hypothetical protein